MRDAIGVSGARGVYSCNHDVEMLMMGGLVVEVLGVVMTALGSSMERQASR